MKLGLKTIFSVAGALILASGLADNAAAQGRQAAPAKGPTAGEFFKNVTTNSLKGLSVDDFLEAMGVISADLAYDCSNCHPGAGTNKVDFVVDTQLKRTARKMIDMVGALNASSFSGVQLVTCYTCHRGSDAPVTTIGLDRLYGPPNEEQRDILPMRDPAAAAKVLDKYIEAVGGAQRLAGLTSYIATGTSVGYGGLGGGGSFQIFAKTPNQRAVVVEFKDSPERGGSIRAFNGIEGWIKTPRGLLNDYDVTGNELDGERLDAQMAFPGQIKQVLNNWRLGYPDTVNGHSVNIVQGTGPRGLLATLYFDKTTNLLTRVVRYVPSTVGRMPTQADFDDYRDVNGIKFPFKYTYSWLDGKDSFQLTGVQINVPIDAARFSKPRK
ncbi:MAG TPA: photosynthetic reaction center cytochrome c subunit family protein [Bryobacteraceae bacterium]|nr:photosynthetic reaction center cytochrome c subunit family protein [Bryobacteraceae bacterium]